MPHDQSRRELVKRLLLALRELVKHQPSCWVRECLEDQVFVHAHTIRNHRVACQGAISQVGRNHIHSHLRVWVKTWNQLSWNLKRLRSSEWRLVSGYPGLIGAFLISEPPIEKFAVQYALAHQT